MFNIFTFLCSFNMMGQAHLRFVWISSDQVLFLGCIFFKTYHILSYFSQTAHSRGAQPNFRQQEDLTDFCCHRLCIFEYVSLAWLLTGSRLYGTSAKSTSLESSVCLHTLWTHIAAAKNLIYFSKCLSGVKKLPYLPTTGWLSHLLLT